MALSNRDQAILVFIAFLLVPVIAYLPISVYGSNPVIAVLMFVLPGLLLVIKELAGSSQPGILDPKSQAILMFIAVTLLSLGTLLGVLYPVSQPVAFIVGLLGAVVAGIKEYLGSLPPSSKPT